MTTDQSNALKTAAIALGAVGLGRLLWRKMKEYDLRDKTVTFDALFPELSAEMAHTID